MLEAKSVYSSSQVIKQITFIPNKEGVLTIDMAVSILRDTRNIMNKV